MRDLLMGMGFYNGENSSELFVNVSGEEEKSVIFEKLRGMGVCFSAGREWSPSEVFEYLREKGFLNGRYRKISWKGPGNYIVEDV